MILVTSEESVAAVESRGGVDETVESVFVANHAKSGDLSKPFCRIATDAVEKGVLGGKVKESRGSSGSGSKKKLS